MSIKEYSKSLHFFKQLIKMQFILNSYPHKVVKVHRSTTGMFIGQWRAL
jgi:hypothetical protein